MAVPAEFLSQLNLRKSAVFSGYSLLVYDYLITFSLEVEHIWNAPWTFIKAGFLLNRYGNLFGQTFIMLAETGYFKHGSSNFCTIFWGYCPFFMLISAESIRILVLLRAFAIWRCMHRVTVFSIILSIFYGLAVMTTMIYPLTIGGNVTFLYIKKVDVCVMPIPPYFWLAWFATIALDSTALVMVWRGLQRLCRESRGTYPSPLIHLLIRDAVMFYTASLFNNVLSIICWTAFSQDPRNFIQLALSFPLLSVVGQRIVLNLRALRTYPLSTSDISIEVDRQIADMSLQLWTDLGLDVEPVQMETVPAVSRSGLRLRSGFRSRSHSASGFRWRLVQVEMESDRERDSDSIQLDPIASRHAQSLPMAVELFR